MVREIYLASKNRHLKIFEFDSSMLLTPMGLKKLAINIQL